MVEKKGVNTIRTQEVEEEESSKKTENPRRNKDRERKKERKKEGNIMRSTDTHHLSVQGQLRNLVHLYMRHFCTAFYEAMTYSTRKIVDTFSPLF